MMFAGGQLGFNPIIKVGKNHIAKTADFLNILALTDDRYLTTKT